jgi:hypothetical protein
MYLCMYVCVYARMYICVYVRIYVCMHVRIYVRIGPRFVRILRCDPRDLGRAAPPLLIRPYTRYDGHDVSRARLHKERTI